MGFSNWRMRIENVDHSRWLIQKSGDRLFVRRQGSRGFWIVRFRSRHYSAILEEQLQSQGVLFTVKHSQRGRDGIQLPGDGCHYLPKEVIQFRNRGERIQASPKGFIRFSQLGRSLLG